MAKLNLENVNKIYDGKVNAVRDFNLEIEDKDFVIFVGPSGCGKSTTLRMIAGLEKITSGTVSIDDKVINDVSAKDRDIAMVFQDYALYPHMTVYDNIAFSLKIKKLPPDQIETAVIETAKILDIEKLLKRKPKALSGGEKQRVAMGRALVRNPRVFLMDEPLSNLDAKLRVQMRAEIKRLHKKLDATIIYVTHDQVEAMTLGTKIVVMKDGVIQQADTPDNLYRYPVNTFVASFIGSPQMNFLDVTISRDCCEAFVHEFDDSVEVNSEYSELLKTKGYAGKRVICGIRPEDVLLKEDAGFGGKVNFVEYLGAEVNIYLESDKSSFVVKATKYNSDESKINFYFDSDKVHFFDIDSLERI